jgi:hypothetical protein
MGREEPPEPVNTPQKTKRARLLWDPDTVLEGCEILTPSERRLVDINTIHRGFACESFALSR